MAPLKYFLSILLLSVDGVLCGKGGKSPEDKTHLLGSDSPAGSRPGSGPPSLLSSDSGSGSGKSMPAAQGPSNTGSSVVTQEQFQKLFGVALDPVSAGDPMARGSCAKYKDRILTAYNDVLAMVREGVDAVDELGMVGRDGRKDEGKDRYNALMGPFEAMYGIQDKTKQADDLRQVKANYESVLTKHQLNVAEKGPRWQIRCGDDFLQWKDANQPYLETVHSGKLNKWTPSHPGHGKPKFPNGAWYAPNMPPEHILLTSNDAVGASSSEAGSSSLKSKLKGIGKGSSKAKGRICDQPGAYAVSFPKAGLLVFCQSILEIDKASSSSEHAPKEWSLAAVNRNIHENTGFNEFMPTIAHIWLHHMFHYALQWTEGSTTDLPSSHIPGWPAAQEVAKKNQKQALKSPENYAVFAAAMYLSDWRWGINGRVVGKIQAQAPAAGSSGSTAQSNPFKDQEDPFQDPPSPGGSGGQSGSSGSGSSGNERQHHAMRSFQA